MSALTLRKINLVDGAIVSPAAWDANYSYLGGNCRVKNVNSQDSVGPALTMNIDVGNDFNLIPSGFNFYDKVTGRLYILTTFVTNQARVLLYNLDRQTLIATPVGQISVLMPATPTFKEIYVVGSGTTGLKIFISTTNTVTATGGPILVNNVAISDFGMVGFTTFNFAFNQTNAAAVYRLTTSVQPGGLNVVGSGAVNVSANVGMFHQSNSIKVFNGLSAAARVLHFQSNASPVHTSAAVTFTIASPGKVNYTAHPFNLNDTVVFPTGSTLPTGITAGTTYFVRNIAANNFELSATSGGASIAFTGAAGPGANIGRAYGETTNLYQGTSGDITPALTGTLTSIGNARLKVKPDAPNSGVSYMSFSTSTNLYRIKTADVAIGSASFTSLELVNILAGGSGPLITTPTLALADWCDDALVNKWLYVTNSIKFVEKDFVNNLITRVFGSLFNRQTEAQGEPTVNFGGIAAIGCILIEDGLIFLSNNTAGIRGIIVMDYKSDAQFNYSYVLSPVLTVNKAVLKTINTIEALFESTGTVRFYVKKQSFDGTFVVDPTATDPTKYWEVNTAEMLDELLENQVQLAFGFDIANEDASTPAQLTGVLLGLLENDTNDSHWVLSKKHSSDESDSPFYVAFRLQYAFEANEGGMPAEHIVDIVDDSNNIVQSFSTVSDISSFSQSTNDGVSWPALVGTPTNTALTTFLRVLVSSPPAGDIRARIRKVD